jgi:hypothetical protein
MGTPVKIEVGNFEAFGRGKKGQVGPSGRPGSPPRPPRSPVLKKGKSEYEWVLVKKKDSPFLDPGVASWQPL